MSQNNISLDPPAWSLPSYLESVDAGLIADQATLYTLQVRDGKIVAGPYVRAACKRHLDDLAFGQERGLRWDLADAQRPIGFFRDVLTVEIEGTDEETGEPWSDTVPFKLEPWQAFIVGSLFGWKNKLGLRRYRRAYCEIAKGSGKSPLAAGIGHYMLSCMKKRDAEIYAAAAMLDQAQVAFRHAVSMWELSPNLRRRLTQTGDKKVTQLSYISPKTGRPAGFFKPISADKKGKSGPKVFCAIVDEVHEHPDNAIIEMMRAGTKGNREALIFEITNSGFDKKTVCGQEHDSCVKIVTGEKQNDSWFVFIACLDEGDEPFEDESCWPKANPNLGISIHPDYVREQVQEARDLPSKEGLVRRLNFCQWTESEKSAIPRALWTAAETEVDPEALTQAGYRCFGGLDLAQVNDLCAFTLNWLTVEIKDQWEFVSKTWFFTPKDTLKARMKRDQAPYDIWAKEGFLEAVPGKILKFGWIADRLMDLCSRYNPVMIGCDEYGLKQLNEKLSEQGHVLPCHVHPQGFQKRKLGEVAELEGTGSEDIALWMPDSINKLEAALLEGRFKVDANPVMRMCSQGVVYTPNRTGHRMFDKMKATTRIDGMISNAMSIGVATLELPQQRSGWNTDDLDALMAKIEAAALAPDETEEASDGRKVVAGMVGTA